MNERPITETSAETFVETVEGGELVFWRVENGKWKQIAQDAITLPLICFGLPKKITE